MSKVFLLDPVDYIDPDGRVNYEKYLSSDDWKEIRAKQLRSQKVCQACGTAKNLHVHHMTYRRLGFEKLKNLRTLCHSCHFRLHEQFDISRKEKGWGRDDLLKFTKRFCKKEKKRRLPI